MPTTDDVGNILCERIDVRNGKPYHKRHHLNPAIANNTDWMQKHGWSIVEPLEKPTPVITEPLSEVKPEDKVEDQLNETSEMFGGNSSELENANTGLNEEVKPKRSYKKRNSKK